MDNEEMIEAWHGKLVRECESYLQRELTPQEEHFIRSRGSFIALEFITDTVATATATELEAYLNSGND